MPTEEELTKMTAEELAALEEQDVTPDVTPDPDPAPSAADIEARLREQMEAEFARKESALRASLVPAAEEPDLDELMLTDPAAYRSKLTEQITGQIMGQVAPLLNRLNTDVVTNELSEGLSGAGRDYVRELAGGIPVQQLQENPKLRDLIRNAAENVEFKATRTANVVGQRATVPMTVQNIPRQEYDMYSQYLSKADLDAILKETNGK